MKAALGYIALFVVAIAGGFAVGAPSMADRAAARLEARVEQLLDVDIDYGGVKWASTGRLTLNDVIVRARSAPDGEPPLFVAPEVAVDADVRWTAARVKVRRIEATGANVYLARRPDGSDNVRGVLRGLARLAPDGAADGDGDGDAARRSGGVGRWLVRSLPEVRASTLGVIVDAPQAASLAEAVGLPTRLTLHRGTLFLRNTALLRENDNLTLDLRFDSTALDPGYGLDVEAAMKLADRSVTGSLTFDRPARVVVGQRVAGVKALTWTGETLDVTDAALSVPVPEGRWNSQDAVDPALTVERVRIVPGPGLSAASLGALSSSDGGVAGLERLVAAIERVELERPALLFERRLDGHSFSDLVGTPPSEVSSDGEDDDERLPPPSFDPDAQLMGLVADGATEEDDELGRAGRKRSKKKKKRRRKDRKKRTPRPEEGAAVRAALIKAFAPLEPMAGALGERVVAAVGRLPLRHIVVRGGHLLTRDVSRPRLPAALSGRWEKFDLDARRSGDVVEFEASFLMPGADRETNRVEGKVHTLTGDTQLHASIGLLRLDSVAPLLPRAVVVDRRSTLFDTRVSFFWSPSTRVARIDGELNLADVGLALPSVAPAPMTGIDLQADLDVEIDGAAGRFVVRPSRVRLGKVDTVTELTVEDYRRVPRIELKLKLPRARVADIHAALPRELLPALSGLKMKGTFGWQLEGRLDTADMESLEYEAWPRLGGFEVVDMGHEIRLEAIRGTFIHRVEQSDGARREMLVGPGSPSWVPLDAISPWMVQAVTTTEDGSFFRHNGFSPFAIRSSIIANLKEGGFVRGASTISQQLVKNLFLSHRKTISRKLQEMFITWQLEQRLDKERIMALYLNIIEWGPGLYGIREAAEHYFGKHPSQLSALECVFLASLIPSPRRYYRQFERGEVTEKWRKHLSWIMRVMVNRDKMDRGEYEAAAPYSPRFRGSEPDYHEDDAAALLTDDLAPGGDADDAGDADDHDVDDDEPLDDDDDDGAVVEPAAELPLGNADEVTTRIP